MTGKEQEVLAEALAKGRAKVTEDGRLAGLEEARQACKAVKAPKGEEYNYRIGHAEGVSECIQAIRALAPPAAPQGSPLPGQKR